jgi:hypothetical protein
MQQHQREKHRAAPRVKPTSCRWFHTSTHVVTGLPQAPVAAAAAIAATAVVDVTRGSVSKASALAEWQTEGA